VLEAIATVLLVRKISFSPTLGQTRTRPTVRRSKSIGRWLVAEALALCPCGCCVRRANWRGESKVTVSTAESSWTRRDFSQRAELHLLGAHLPRALTLDVAEGSRVVGIGAAVFENLELRACYVAPAASRKGVGSALVKEIERAAREQRVPRLDLDSSVTAECFYRTVGYEVVERGEHFLGNGRRMACVRMRKELGA
jgi:GNAT superfamily N-acetyltransferase